jgi:hypothetical protein
LQHLLPRKPALCVSGINVGANLGDDVLYSGTVAAAIEATLCDVPALAVSHAARGRQHDFMPAARIALRVGRGDHEALFTGDLIHSPLQARYPELSMRADFDPAQAAGGRFAAEAGVDRAPAGFLGLDFLLEQRRVSFAGRIVQPVTRGQAVAEEYDRARGGGAGGEHAGEEEGNCDNPEGDHA